MEQSTVGSSAKNLAEQGLLSLVPIAASAYRQLRCWSDSLLGLGAREPRWSMPDSGANPGGQASEHPPASTPGGEKPQGRAQASAASPAPGAPLVQRPAKADPGGGRRRAPSRARQRRRGSSGKRKAAAASPAGRRRSRTKGRLNGGERRGPGRKERRPACRGR